MRKNRYILLMSQQIKGELMVSNGVRRRKMAKKSLILYSSMTGNTEKVALRFKKVFERKGWQCDAFKIDRHTDADHPPFHIEDYDFLCVGSPVMMGIPSEEIRNFLSKSPLSGHFGQPTVEELARQKIMRHDPDYMGRPKRRPGKERPTGKIVPGPQKGIVFVTYGGIHLGPKEAAAALMLLENELEHLKFECIGSFACPGKHGDKATPEWWHGDIRHRPSERDLQKAEIFMEEKIEELHL
jgi:hypothetical protein